MKMNKYRMNEQMRTNINYLPVHVQTEKIKMRHVSKIDNGYIE